MFRAADDKFDVFCEQDSNLIQSIGKSAAATLAAALLSASSIAPAAIATEFDVMNTSVPSLNYLIDDAGVLNKTTKKSVNDRLYKLEASVPSGLRCSDINCIASHSAYVMHCCCYIVQYQATDIILAAELVSERNPELPLRLS